MLPKSTMREWCITLVRAREQYLGRVEATAIPRPLLRCWLRLTALALVCACLALPRPAAAQQDFFTFRQQTRPSPPERPSHLHRRSGDAPMRVMAARVDYDYADHQFAAVGNVQIYYNGATIEATRVIYDQKTKRLRAEGNARLTEANGKVTYGEIIDLTDYYRDGFVDALGVEAVAPRRAARLPQRRRLPPRQ
jgi:LPS-assembly protein